MGVPLYYELNLNCNLYFRNQTKRNKFIDVPVSMSLEQCNFYCTLCALIMFICYNLGDFSLRLPLKLFYVVDQLLGNLMQCSNWMCHDVSSLKYHHFLFFLFINAPAILQDYYIGYCGLSKVYLMFRGWLSSSFPSNCVIKDLFMVYYRNEEIDMFLQLHELGVKAWVNQSQHGCFLCE